MSKTSKTASFPKADAHKEGPAATALDPSSLTALDAELSARSTVTLDTSVLMADPRAHLAFGGAAVVVALTVIDELDANKSRPDDAGRNARTALRLIEDLRSANGGDLSTAVALPDGGTFRIEPNGLRLDELKVHHLDPRTPDHRIIAAALGLAAEGKTRVRLVSNDASLRIKAGSLGLAAEEYTPGQVGVHAPNRTGQRIVEVTYPTIELAQSHRRFHLGELCEDDRAQFDGMLLNEFALLRGTALQVRLLPGDLLVAIDERKEVWGLRPRNKEQACALDLCTDQSIALVALRGHAGTGKSILAIAAGLQQVAEDKTYDQLMILRPMISVGRQEMGFLPGDVAEKTAPWFAAVVDAMVSLSNGRQTFKQAQETLTLLVDQGKVAMEPITFLRGRSLNRVYAVLDEAQNVEPSTVKTVVSRLGDGSKLILNGDDGQVDSPWVSSVTCGLNVAVDAFAGVDLFGQVFFTKGERSRLADLAAERL